MWVIITISIFSWLLLSSLLLKAPWLSLPAGMVFLGHHLISPSSYCVDRASCSLFNLIPFPASKLLTIYFSCSAVKSWHWLTPSTSALFLERNESIKVYYKASAAFSCDFGIAYLKIFYPSSWVEHISRRNCASQSLREESLSGFSRVNTKTTFRKRLWQSGWKKMLPVYDRRSLTMAEVNKEPT